MTRNRYLRSTLLVAICIFLGPITNAVKEPIPNADNHWPMSGGPQGTWTTKTQHLVPTAWSVSNNRNIL